MWRSDYCSSNSFDHARRNGDDVFVKSGNTVQSCHTSSTIVHTT